MPDVVHALVATDVTESKLAARSISRIEVQQMLRNWHVVARNRRRPTQRRPGLPRRLLIGKTDGGRALTLVIEGTLDPTTWLLITGWEATPAERKMARR
jgi:hypothetical protein